MIDQPSRIWRQLGSKTIRLKTDSLIGRNGLTLTNVNQLSITCLRQFYSSTVHAETVPGQSAAVRSINSQLPGSWRVMQDASSSSLSRHLADERDAPRSIGGQINSNSSRIESRWISSLYLLRSILYQHVAIHRIVDYHWILLVEKKS